MGLWVQVDGAQGLSLSKVQIFTENLPLGLFAPFLRKGAKLLPLRYLRARLFKLIDTVSWQGSGEMLELVIRILLRHEPDLV